MTYDAIYRGRNKSRGESCGRNRSSSNNKSCKYCGKMYSKGNCAAYGKNVENVEEKTTLNLSVEVVEIVMINETIVILGQGKAKKGKRFHEINEEISDSMDDLADQVQSFFYHDVHFNSINTENVHGD